MRIPASFAAALALFLFIYSASARANKPSDLVLPPVIYAVVGESVSIVFRNADLIPPGESFQFGSVDCRVGETAANHESWSFTPAKTHLGDHSFVLKSGNRTASTIIRVVPRDAGSSESISLLIVGDSLTNASHYPNEIARLLSKPGNPKWKMSGTHHPKSAAENVAHEGYGGWTWNRFNTRWEPSQPQTGKTRSSPFLFLKDGSPQLNVSQYLQENAAGKHPDFATFLLGINDCFHANPDDPAAIEARIDTMLTEADRLLAAFRKATTDTEIGICLTPPPNDRDAAFVANYKDRYPRWGWRRIQFRLVQRQLEHFGDREDENIFIVPTSTGIDPMTGYPGDNAVHPNPAGYQTIGSEIYAWLKWRLAVRSE